MTFVLSALGDGQVADSKGTIYTTPALTTAVLKSAVFHNGNSSAETLILYAHDGTASRILAQAVLQPDETFVYDEPLVLETGDLLEAVTTTASIVDYWLSGETYTALGGSIVLARLASGTVPTTAGTVYTVPGSTKALLSHINLYNETAPSGGNPGGRVEVWLNGGTDRQILDICLQSYTSFFWRIPVVLETGDTIEMVTDSGVTVHYWISGGEES